MAEYTRTAQSQVTLSQAAGTHRGGPGRCSASPVAVRRSAQRPAPRVIIAAAATAIRIEMCVVVYFQSPAAAQSASRPHIIHIWISHVVVRPSTRRRRREINNHLHDSKSTPIRARVSNTIFCTVSRGTSTSQAPSSEEICRRFLCVLVMSKKRMTSSAAVNLSE